jgi:hypothetical protein
MVRAFGAIDKVICQAEKYLVGGDPANGRIMESRVGHPY